MRNVGRVIGLLYGFSLIACAGEETPVLDNFARGQLPLVLEPAPGALCEGGGSDKECGPQGCVQAPVASAAPMTRSNVSFGSAAPGSVPGPSMASAPSGAAPPSPQGPSVQSPMPVEPMAPSAGMGASAGSGGSAGNSGMAGSSANACSALPDGGVLADGGLSAECQDSGVQATPAALIEDDVPGCAQVNPQQPSTLYLSADDSNSMAGPAIARRMILAGQLVPAHVIRPWEFLNYYDFSFEPAAPGQVRIVPQLSSCPQGDRLSLQVALQAEARTDSARAPLNLTFVVDTSGSMGQPQQLGGALPIELARAAIRALAGRLHDGDVVSMVTWNTAQLVLLSGHVVHGANDSKLLATADALVPDGGTDLHSGLVRGYELAQQHLAPERINRLILISDGIANVGVTDEALIARHADDEEGADGVYLSGIGVGDGFNDTLMNTVTDAGRGAYVYLDSLAEAERMLGQRYLQVVDVAARSVRLEVNLPHYLVLEKFFGEVASTDASKVRPQHLGPNDAMLFFQVLRACDPALLHGDDRIRMRATWEVPFTRAKREAVIDTTLNALAGNDDDLTKAAAIAGYAEALVSAATDTRPDAARVALHNALAHVRGAKDAATDPDLIEVAMLLERYLLRYPALPQPQPTSFAP